MLFQRIHIELTNRCNFSCVFCPNSLMTRPRRDLKLNLALKALDEIAAGHLSDTIFFHIMGEAVLYPHLEEVIRYAKYKNLKIALTTNGWGLSFDLLKRILNAGVDHISFSVQTPDKDSFKLRQAPVDFFAYRKKICSLIAKVIEHGSTKVTLSFLTTPMPFLILPSKRYNIIRNKRQLVSFFTEWLEEIAALLEEKTLAEKLRKKKELLIRRLLFFRMFGWNRLKLTEKFFLETRILGDWVHRGLSAEKMTKARIGYCEGLKTHFGILSNGDMVFCCVDFDGKTSFGNIKYTTIREALAQKKVQDAASGFKKFLVKEPYCQRCLGDASFEKSAVRQIGSIFYFKMYRPWWEKKREKEDVLL